MIDKIKESAKERKENKKKAKAKKKPYGGISNISKYLQEQYGQKGVLVKRGRGVVMNQQSMEQISGRKTRNCSVVAVTRVLDYYRKTRNIPGIPEDIRERMYPQNAPDTDLMANRDFHTMYVGEIVDAYIIR